MASHIVAKTGLTQLKKYETTLTAGFDEVSLAFITVPISKNNMLVYRNGLLNTLDVDYTFNISTKIMEFTEIFDTNSIVTIFWNVPLGDIPNYPTNFWELSDTPANYTGQANKYLTVKNDETGIEFKNFPDATTEIKGISEIATNEETIAGTDNTKIITPSTLKSWFNYSNPIQTQASIFGVQATHQTALDGVALQHVDLYGQPITLDIIDINAHPAYGTSGSFVETTDASNNVFCTIPIAYWWRGYINGKWTLLVSDKAGTFGGKTFKASRAAFYQEDVWLDQFYIGKYRGSANGDSTKVCSVAGIAHWGNVTFDNFKTYCSNNGSYYHMLSLFEWHEILGRMVIEKATFQLMPEAIRATQESCIYRGINDFCYGPSSGVTSEWMDGIRTDASGNFEIWSSADGTYISSGKKCFQYSFDESDIYTQSLYSEMDNLFIADNGGPIATSFIPNGIGMTPRGYVSKACIAFFSASLVHYGALYSDFYYIPSLAIASVGCRLATWY